MKITKLICIYPQPSERPGERPEPRQLEGGARTEAGTPWALTWASAFLQRVQPPKDAPYDAAHEWNLLSLQSLQSQGLGLGPQFAELSKTDWPTEEYARALRKLARDIPFKVQHCQNPTTCCGVCTFNCPNRCVQDCLHRLYLYRALAAYGGDRVSLGIRMLAKARYETLPDLAGAIGEILAASIDADKIDYSCRPAVDARGAVRVDPTTNEIIYDYWPTTGLCPYCIPVRPPVKPKGRKL